MEQFMKLREFINLEKIDWYNLSENPSAIKLLEATPEKIRWAYLSGNPAIGAIKLLEANQEKIDWECLSANPSIFEYDYKAMKIECITVDYLRI